MASPLVEATNSSTTPSASVNHSIALPAGIVSGELLLAAISGRQLFGTIPTGWSRPLVLSHSGQSDVLDIHLYQRTADETEGSTLAFESSSSLETSHVSARISGWASLESATAESSSTGAPNPPSITPSAGLADYLFIVLGCLKGNRTVTAAPTNYINFLNPNTGTSSLGDSHLGFATRSLNASSEDPGEFTSSSVEHWVAATLAVLPAAGLDLVRAVNETLRI